MLVIDARGWEPPAPFEAVMEALCALRPGQQILFIIDREPLPLYRALDRNGYAHRTTRFEDDGRFEVVIGERAALI